MLAEGVWIEAEDGGSLTAVLNATPITLMGLAALPFLGYLQSTSWRGSI